MEAPVSASIEGDLIQAEIAAAKDTLDRYYDLTEKEYREQKARLATIEERLAFVEKRLGALDQATGTLAQSTGALGQATDTLRLQVKSMTESRIWRTLVKGGKLFSFGSGKGGEAR
jgi:hypothetical protein